MIYDVGGRPDDFVYLEVNHAFDEITGAEIVMGKRATEVYPGIKEESPELVEIFGRVARTGKPEVFDLDFKPIGKWLHISVYSPLDLHFVAIFEDITQRRKVEEALALYKIFTENAHDIILFIRKSDSRIIEANKAAIATYGYTREELLGLTVFDLRPSDRVDIITRQMDKAAQDGIVFTALHRKKDGSDLPVEVSSVSMIFEDEPVIVSIIRDISERKRAEEVQALLASIVTHSEDAIFSKTLSGIITSWNAGAEKIYGYTREEVIGKHVSFLAPVEYADDIEFILEKGRAGEPVENYETTRVRRDGQRFAVSISVSPIRNANGDLIGSSTIVRDITLQKQADEKIKSSEIRYRRLFESAKDGILILNRDTGVILDANPFIGFLTGYPLEELVGKYLWDIGFFKDLVSSKIAFSDLQTTEYIRYDDLPLETKDGQKIDVEFVSNVYPVDHTSVIQCNIRDITERKKIQDALSIANKKLNILNNITRHDILNQITSIEGFLELYYDEYQEDAKALGYFNRLIGLTKTIENQISFTKYYQDLGMQAPIWQRVQDVAWGAARSGGFGEIRFVIEDMPLWIFTDPLLEKVFYNLYDNSLRHGEHVTEIRVSTSFSDDDCIIIVEDNGIGIPVEDKDRIFERGVGKHTGLGMFLVREILAITGVTIREIGEPGSGARFEIVVPKGAYRS
jgi:PAS domain S-box-containing protein